MGKPYIKQAEFSSNAVIIMIGITGAMRGHVLIALDYEKALKVASKMMMGMELKELDTMAISAVGELGNMIMGNAATIFSTKGIGIDITPPTICRGDNIVVAQAYTQNICIPLNGNDVAMELDVAIKDA